MVTNDYAIDKVINNLSKGNDIIDGGDIRRPYRYGSRADILKKNFLIDVDPSLKYFTNSRKVCLFFLIMISI